MITFLLLFLMGITGFVLNRKNIILRLLSVTFLILITLFNFDDILGQIYAIYIIAIACAESAIELAILVAFYRLRGSIAIEFN